MPSQWSVVVVCGRWLVGGRWCLVSGRWSWSVVGGWSVGGGFVLHLQDGVDYPKTIFDHPDELQPDCNK